MRQITAVLLNHAKALFGTILLLSCVVGAIGQNLREAVLVDEFSMLPCDDFLGRLDLYLSELSREPTNKGLVIVRNDPKERHRSSVIQGMIEAHFRWRGWKQQPLEYVRADKDGEELVQLWRLPQGSKIPDIDRRIESFPMHESVRKPFMLAYESNFGGICPEIDDQRIFANFLKANPSARANIVIRDVSNVRALQKGTKVIRKLETRYGISRTRLRIFPTKLQRPTNHDEPVVEYWYLP